MDKEARIVDLEIKISYQDELVNDLNKVVCQQQKQIDALQETCGYLMERVKRLLASAEGEPSNDKPPHY